MCLWGDVVLEFAAGADAVLDDDRLAEPFLKFGSHCAHHDVDAAAGRESDDEGDRSARELLSEATATERKEACQRGRNQNGTTCDHSSFPSDARQTIRIWPEKIVCGHSDHEEAAIGATSSRP
jgi:hypothetical protein